MRLLKPSTDITNPRYPKSFALKLVSLSKPVRNRLSAWRMRAQATAGPDPKGLYELIMRTINKTGLAVRIRNLEHDYHLRAHHSTQSPFPSYP
ncbi:hypothetical protein CONLIGDRAFT_637692 [Coniochaeta ligniaria NRRL 30616]|uniref:Uncharacterized protein n=1 Tax=Coniochaeta ligniaria NRRL 30616 TaxID=1408157 RepID=A0A1J7I7W0_9PEZI|nr:hypothetical protein CONLIGDRAFT_637692 [Coniochaeta ligniaria NRRL 30616]